MPSKLQGDVGITCVGVHSRTFLSTTYQLTHLMKYECDQVQLDILQFLSYSSNAWKINPFALFYHTLYRRREVSHARAKSLHPSCFFVVVIAEKRL